MEFELRVSQLLGRHSATWATPLALFVSSYFLPRAWPLTSYLCLPHSWAYRSEPSRPPYWLRWGLVNFLSGRIMTLPVSSFQVAGIGEPHTQLKLSYAGSLLNRPQMRKHSHLWNLLASGFDIKNTWTHSSGVWVLWVVRAAVSWPSAYKWAGENIKQ
jgi:hypothetical protein